MNNCDTAGLVCKSKLLFLKAKYVTLGFGDFAGEIVFQFFERCFRSFNIPYDQTFIQHHDALTNFGYMNKVVTGN